MNTNKTAHHPGIEADVSVRLVLVPLSRVDLDHVKLSVLPVPVDDALRPPSDTTPRAASTA